MINAAVGSRFRSRFAGDNAKSDIGPTANKSIGAGQLLRKNRDDLSLGGFPLAAAPWFAPKTLCTEPLSHTNLPDS